MEMRREDESHQAGWFAEKRLEAHPVSVNDVSIGEGEVRTQVGRGFYAEGGDRVTFPTAALYEDRSAGVRVHNHPPRGGLALEAPGERWDGRGGECRDDDRHQCAWLHGGYSRDAVPENR